MDAVPPPRGRCSRNECIIVDGVYLCLPAVRNNGRLIDTGPGISAPRCLGINKDEGTSYFVLVSNVKSGGRSAISCAAKLLAQPRVNLREANEDWA